DRDLTRRLVEALGHVRPGGLVPEGHEADAVLVERRKQGVDLGRRETEDEAHALVREAACEQGSTVQVGHGTPPLGLAAPLPDPSPHWRNRCRRRAPDLRRRECCPGVRDVTALVGTSARFAYAVGSRVPGAG